MRCCRGALNEGYALTCCTEERSPVNGHRTHRVTDDESEQPFLACLDHSFDLATARDLNLGV
ncbi:MAG: hypothetical protein HY321_12145 [Armatimonadetes bacterium]|nr:hypothetical protein [Armatimonadota bacterium]